MPHTAKDENRVMKWVRKWKKELGLDLFYIEVQFRNGVDEDERRLATMQADIKYNQALLTIYDDFWARGDQEPILLHEMTHILTQPMRGLGWDVTQGERQITWRHFDDANEHETEWVSAIIWKIYNKNK